MAREAAVFEEGWKSGRREVGRREKRWRAGKIGRMEGERATKRAKSGGCIEEGWKNGRMEGRIRVLRKNSVSGGSRQTLR